MALAIVCGITNHGRGGNAPSSLPSLGALSTAIASMAAGDWLNWTSSTNAAPITDTSGPGGVSAAWLESAGNLPLTNWPGKFTWDQSRQRLIIVGTAQGYIGESPTGAHSSAAILDVTTGVFSKQWNPMSADLGHVYDNQCSEPLNGKIYRRPYNNANLYECDLTTDTWSVAKDITSLTLGAYGGLEAFPTLGASGSVVFLTPGGALKRWDIATDALSTIGTPGGIGDYGTLHYSEATDALIFGGGTTGTTYYKCDSSGTVTSIAGMPSGVTSTGASANAASCPDPLGRAKSWLFPFGGSVWELDHGTGTWTEREAMPALTHGMPVCAIQDYGVVVGFEGRGRANSTTSMSRIWIYKVH